MAEIASEGRKILVAVDESEESMYALRWCLENLASDVKGDTLILLFARPPPPDCPSLDGTGYLLSADVIATLDRYSKGLAATVMEKTKGICKDFQKVKIDKKVVVGDPRDVICEMAEKLGVNMLVMGSHGYGFIKSGPG